MVALPAGLLFPDPWTDAKRALTTGLVLASIALTALGFALALRATRVAQGGVATAALVVACLTGSVWLLFGLVIALAALSGGGFH